MHATLPLAIVRKLRAVADMEVRRRLARETLPSLDAGSLARYLVHVLDHLDQPDVRPLWLDAALVLLDPSCLTVTLREDARLAAAVPDGHPLAGLMSDIVGRPPRAERAAPRDLDDQPLGVRKARARLRNRDAIRRLATDPDAGVIAVLVENPISTEAEALRIASLRPQTPAIFDVLLASPRFGVRETVLAAMAQNPWCPLRVALAALPLLTRPHLRDVSEATRLDARLRKAATVLAGP